MKKNLLVFCNINFNSSSGKTVWVKNIRTWSRGHLFVLYLNAFIGIGIFSDTKFKIFVDLQTKGQIFFNFPQIWYTVIQNFGFSLPKHSVLKNLPKLPIIQLMFWVKSTKHSSQFQHTRSFIFGKIYKFNTKLRDFPRNISGIAQWVTCHIRSTFFRSNQLAAWSGGLRCWLWAQKVLGSSPKQARKEEQKIQILPGDQKSESNFSRIQSEINNRNFGPEFSAWFCETVT
jgi:hypothetical protein